MRIIKAIIVGAGVTALAAVGACTKAPVEQESREKPTRKAVEHDRNPVVAPVSDASSATPQFYEYTVKKGDTLSEIADRFYGKWVRYPEIARANGIKDPNLIFPDQKLLLKRPVKEGV